MANTTDKSILTAAGKALLAQLNAEEKPLIIDKMIFANVPNRPEFPQPDDVVPDDFIVHQEGVEQRGRLSADSVIYSTTLTSDVGPFEFNWTGAYCSEYGVLVTVDHHALTPKTADEPGVAGNTLVRSVVLEYKDIAEITNITVDASTWQYNATERLKKMDTDVAQAIIDQNGKDWFIEDGFLVTPQASTFNIKAGAGYVSGNRVMLEFDRNVQVPNKPSFIYVDAHREGTPNGEQVTLFDFVVTAEEKDDYTDTNGVKHLVCKIAQVLADGSASDLRPEGDKASREWVTQTGGYHKVIIKNGTLEREIREKCGDEPSIYDFGGKLDGTFDNATALNKAYSAGINHLKVPNVESGVLRVGARTELPDDFELMGIGRPTMMLTDRLGPAFWMNSKSIVDGFHITGDAQAVFSPYNNSDSSKVSNCTFYGQNQIFLLYKCENAQFINNYLFGTGYGVIQQANYESNNVIISGNNAKGLVGDFVEANCTGNAISRNWIVSNNVYDGGGAYPVPQTEDRFAGFTGVENIIVLGNVVKNVAGDSCVHLEDLGGNTIVANNIFENWLGRDCVYLLSNDEDTLVNSNIFRRTDIAAVGRQVAISDDSNNYSNKLMIANNMFKDETGEHKLIAMVLQYGSNTQVLFNQVWGCNTFVQHKSYSNLDVIGNFVRDTSKGVYSPHEGSGSAGNDIRILMNSMRVLEKDYGIYGATNDSGTSGPKNYDVRFNDIDADINLLNRSGATGQTENNICTGNKLRNGAVATVASIITPDSNGNWSL